MNISEKLYGIMSRADPSANYLLKGTDKALSEMHPGENEAAVQKDFVIKKLSRCLLIFGVGILFAVLLHFTSRSNPFEENRLKRASYGGGETTYKLVADDGKNSYKLEIDVLPRQMTEEVFFEKTKEFHEKVGELICGENTDLQNVRFDLLLEEEYPEFPFEVSWRSYAPEVIDSAGRVHAKREAGEVRLGYTLYYGEFSEESEITVMTAPGSMTEEEFADEELRQMILSAEENSRYEEQMPLPADWHEKTLSWRENRKDYSIYVFLLTPMLATLLYFLTDYDLMKEAEERRRILKREYPEFVNKLVLFVGAGMSVRGAFGRLQKEYAENKDSPCGKEITLLCGHLAAGMSESTAYEQFGRRTGVRDYIRLCALLTQNLKRGNAALLERLAKEAERSSEDDLLNIKKKGEEAGTKLLVPMVLLLGIIMVIIIVPAFSTL